MPTAQLAATATTPRVAATVHFLCSPLLSFKVSESSFKHFFRSTLHVDVLFTVSRLSIPSMNHNQQNTYIGPPIFPRVPVEILSEIFLRCVPDSYEELNADLSWIPTVSHVNRHWREVALACPELWTSIIFSKPKWVPVMLSRSKKAPLVIKVDLDECSFDILRLVLYGHLDNIQEVDICGT